MSRARAAAVLATTMTAGALSLAWGMPTAHADPLDAIKDTVTRDRAQVRPKCYPYFYDPALEAIAQTYARSENPADVTSASYDGDRVGFLGSGDPEAAATTSAYRRGAGDMVSNCDYGSFGVGFVRHADRSVDVVTIVFGKHAVPPPAPPVAHVTNPVGPDAAPCPSANYEFAGATVELDFEDYTAKNVKGTVVTVPTSGGRISGRADGSFTGLDHGGGQADGHISGRNVDITVVFDGGESGGVFNGVTAHFTGTVLARGGAAGTVSGPGLTGVIGWHTQSTQSTGCVDTASDSTPTVTKPATAPKSTATVTDDVDLYEGPNGTGGTNGFLPEGKTVTVAAPCTPDAFCNLVAPAGSAWGQFLRND